MSCSMELLNWAEDCYTQKDLPDLPFEIISKILQDRRKLRQIDNTKKNFNAVLDFFKQGLITNVPEHKRINFETNAPNNIEDIWQRYVESGDFEVGEEAFYSQPLTEEFEDNYFFKSYASFWVGCMNLNLYGAVVDVVDEDEEDDYFDSRFDNTWCKFGKEPWESITWSWVLE